MMALLVGRGIIGPKRVRSGERVGSGGHYFLRRGQHAPSVQIVLGMTVLGHLIMPDRPAMTCPQNNNGLSRLARSCGCSREAGQWNILQVCPDIPWHKASSF